MFPCHDGAKHDVYVLQWFASADGNSPESFSQTIGEPQRHLEKVRSHRTS
jgi:hypothetical protein